MVNVRNSFVATPPIDIGVLHSAPLGAEFPETALAELPEAFAPNDHGAVDENGLGINKTRSTQKIRMLGGGVFREPQTEYDEMVTVTLLEDDNLAVLVNEYGEDNVEVEEATATGQHKTIYHMPGQLPIQSWVLTVIDGAKTKRYLIELGQITQTAELTDKHSDVTKHQWTITTYASTKFKGAHIVELRHDGSIVAVAGRGIVEGQVLRAATVALDPADDPVQTQSSAAAVDTAQADSADTAPPAEKSSAAAEPEPDTAAQSASTSGAAANKNKSTGTASTSK